MQSYVYAIVEPIPIFGAECWQLSTINKKQLETAEINFFGKANRVTKVRTCS